MANDKNLQNSLNSYLSDEDKKKQMEQLEQEMDCSSGVCVIKTGKGLVERINKTIITEDGRQLLF